MIRRFFSRCTQVQGHTAIFIGLGLFVILLPNIAFGGLFGEVINDLTNFVALIPLHLGGFLVGISGAMLDFVVSKYVFGMSVEVDRLRAVEAAWTVFRDIANLSFIFILLYAAIATILNIDQNLKKLIPRLIIVAILLNFSLFFSQVVIDISNFTALQFYRAPTLQICDENDEGELVCSDPQHVKLSEAFMQSLKLTTIVSIPADGGDPYVSDEGLKGISFLSKVVYGLVGGAFLIIAAFLFAAAAGMFLLRFVMLILLMMVSPLAFAASLLPAFEKQFKSWAEKLLKNAFFAPLYFGIMYVTLLILNQIKNDIGSIGSASGVQAWVNIAVNFFIVSVFLVTALVSANSLGAFGAKKFLDTGKKWGTKIGSNLAKNTLGWTAMTAGIQYKRGVSKLRGSKLVLGTKDLIDRGKTSDNKGIRWATKAAALGGRGIKGGANVLSYGAFPYIHGELQSLEETAESWKPGGVRSLDELDKKKRERARLIDRRGVELEVNKLSRELGVLHPQIEDQQGVVSGLEFGSEERKVAQEDLDKLEGQKEEKKGRLRTIMRDLNLQEAQKISSIRAANPDAVEAMQDNLVRQVIGSNEYFTDRDRKAIEDARFGNSAVEYVDEKGNTFQIKRADALERIRQDERNYETVVRKTDGSIDYEKSTMSVESITAEARDNMRKLAKGLTAEEISRSSMFNKLTPGSPEFDAFVGSLRQAQYDGLLQKGVLPSSTLQRQVKEAREEGLKKFLETAIKEDGSVDIAKINHVRNRNRKELARLEYYNLGIAGHWMDPSVLQSAFAEGNLDVADRKKIYDNLKELAAENIDGKLLTKVREDIRASLVDTYNKDTKSAYTIAEAETEARRRAAAEITRAQQGVDLIEGTWGQTYFLG